MFASDPASEQVAERPEVQVQVLRIEAELGAQLLHPLVQLHECPPQAFLLILGQRSAVDAAQRLACWSRETCSTNGSTAERSTRYAALRSSFRSRAASRLLSRAREASGSCTERKALRSPAAAAALARRYSAPVTGSGGSASASPGRSPSTRTDSSTAPRTRSRALASSS